MQKQIEEFLEKDLHVAIHFTSGETITVKSVENGFNGALRCESEESHIQYAVQTSSITYVEGFKKG